LKAAWLVLRRGRQTVQELSKCEMALLPTPQARISFISCFENWGLKMSDSTRETLLKVALGVFGVIFFLIYPLGMVWPSGWVWHGGEGKYYLQMICGVYAVLGAFLINAARNPSEHRSLIWFTICSSIVHALIMAGQSLSDGHEMGHLVGDVPALLLVAFVLWVLLPAKRAALATA
jgi:hypothetical protein